ncbi:MAG: PAS domain S-box protein, partial [Euryarchaeota archaeon]|nr:PAS domain S-box protein [Euryarchaeota archaeon]
MLKHRLSIAVGSLGFLVNGAYIAYEYFFMGSFHILSLTLEHIIIILWMPLGLVVGYLVEKNIQLQQALAECTGGMEVQPEKGDREGGNVTRYLESVIQNAGDAIVMAEKDGNIMYWNKGAENLFGYSREEALGASIEMVIPVGRREEFQDIFGEVLKGERVVDFETKWQTKDGRVLDVLVTFSPIIDERGSIVGASGIIRDIAELKNLQRELKEYSQELEKKVEEQTRELRESEEMYRLLVENASDGIYVRTLDGELTFVNRRYAEIYGYEPEELIGKNVKDFKAPEESEKLEAIFKKAVKERKVPELIETKSLRKNGTTAYLTIRPSLVIKDGEVVGIQGVVRDITRQRIMEEEIRGYAMELEKAS